MPTTIDRSAAPSYLVAPAREPDSVHRDDPDERDAPVTAPVAESDIHHHRSGWPIVILASGGTGAAAALLAGPFVGPLGALVAGAAGIILGVAIQRSQKSKAEAK